MAHAALKLQGAIFSGAHISKSMLLVSYSYMLASLKRRRSCVFTFTLRKLSDTMLTM